MCLHISVISTWLKLKSDCLLLLLLQEGALLQASGEALYTGDEPLAPNALYAAFVTSKRAAGRLARVDWAPALAVEGERAGWLDGPRARRQSAAGAANGGRCLWLGVCRAMQRAASQPLLLAIYEASSSQACCTTVQQSATIPPAQT